MTPPTVLLQKYAEITGYTRKALENKIERGEIAEGLQYYRAPDGRIHIDIEGMYQWVKRNSTPGSRSMENSSA